MKRRTDDQRAPSDSGAHRPVEAVLLDIDGTLLDSTDAHAQAWSDVFREAGYDIGSEVVHPLIGMGSDKLVPQLTGLDADQGPGKQLVERRKEVFLKEYLPSVRRFDMARELVERMRADGLRLVVATSASDDELQGLLKTLGAEWLREAATSSSDVDRSKPDPDIVQVAVERAGAGPAHCVMLGDTPYDVEAATRAGVAIIGLRCGGWGDEELRGAAELYEDPADLLARYDVSLIGRSVRQDASRRGERGTHGDRASQSGEGGPQVEGT